MPEDHSKGPQPPFPELELDLGPVQRARQAAAVVDDAQPHEVSIELDAPASKRSDLGPPPGSLAPPAGAPAMGPPVSIRGAPPSLGPPGSPSLGPPASPSAPPASLAPSSMRMGPPPGYASGTSAAPPAAAPGEGAEPAPSAGAALMARARSAAQDPGAVARNVVDLGNRTSTALVMLGGAILLTLLDVIYSRFTGERFSIGPFKLVWIAGPLALVGAVVLGIRIIKERLE